MGAKILIVDDEQNIVDILRANLEREGYQTLSAYDGIQAVEMGISQKPDLILLDCMLPKMDGFDVCRKLRQQTNVPILMLTAKSEEIDKVLGLELGADDYITKPFSVREVLARVKAQLRRVNIVDSGSEDHPKVMVFGDLEMIRKPIRCGARRCDDLTLLNSNCPFPGPRMPACFFPRSIARKGLGYEYLWRCPHVDVTVVYPGEIGADPHHYHYIMTKRGVVIILRKILSQDQPITCTDFRSYDY